MKFYLFLLAVLCIHISCNQQNHQQNIAADAVPNNMISSSAAVEKNKETERKFIRTADVKFKVNDVTKATNDIENICTAQDGFVIYTNLASTIDDHSETIISTDSLLETTSYTITNNMTLRVPNTKLDTTLKEIAKNIEYLDYRIIKADDVNLQILANDLAQKRVSNNYKRVVNEISNNPKKLEETLYAEEHIVSKQEEADNAKICNLSLADKIKFSTINLFFYQRQGIKRSIIYNDKNIEKYEISFWKKLIESIVYGWKIFLNIILFLSKIWGIALLAATIFFGIKWGIKSLTKKPQV